MAKKGSERANARVLISGVSKLLANRTLNWPTPRRSEFGAIISGGHYNIDLGDRYMPVPEGDVVEVLKRW